MDYIRRLLRVCIKYDLIYIFKIPLAMIMTLPEDILIDKLVEIKGIGRKNFRGKR